jgi:hypothetical protein
VTLVLKFARAIKFIFVLGRCHLSLEERYRGPLPRIRNGRGEKKGFIGTVARRRLG